MEVQFILTTTVSEKGFLYAPHFYGADCPFSIDSGYLYCETPGSHVVIESNSEVYALNGKAMGTAEERNYIIARDTIFLTDDNGFYTVGDVTSIIQRGLEMCD